MAIPAVSKLTGVPGREMPPYTRGFIDGLDDAAAFARTMSTKAFPSQGLDKNALIKLGDALDLFQGGVESMAASMEVKAKTARETFWKIVSAPQGGQA